MKHVHTWCGGTGIEPDGIFTKNEDIGKVCTSCKGTGIESDGTYDLVCPYCGEEESDSWECGDSDDDHVCGHCGKHFKYETEHTRTFSSFRVPCLNGEEHEWKKISDNRYPDGRYCPACTKYEYGKKVEK